MSIAANTACRLIGRNMRSSTRTASLPKILSHSGTEQRFFCFGWVDGGVMTVRFTYRKGRIRIFGAGHWRKGKKIYEQQNG